MGRDESAATQQGSAAAVFGVLALGFLIGMQHAMEADHVAAVASIASGERSARRMVRHGVAWGAGHTLTLLVVGAVVAALGAAVPDGLAQALEVGVGVMLTALGGWVLARLARERVHVHVHRHGDGVAHMHAHSHAGERRADHDADHHRHAHPRGLPLRTFAVGVMHGMAGSAALLVVSAASLDSAPLGLLYIAVFGVGSIVGMAALSALIAVPLTRAARLATRLRRLLEGVIGVATLALGVVVVYQNAIAG